MDIIQMVNLKNIIKSINDENIHNFFVDKNNIISMAVSGDEFRVSVNDAYLIFQKGDLLDYIIDTIDRYIVKEQSCNKDILFADMRNLTEEEQNSLYKALDDMSIDTGIQLFPEVNVYDYKKNLEHLKERYKNKIKYLDDNKIEYGGYNDGIIDGLKNALHDIDDMLNGLEV